LTALAINSATLSLRLHGFSSPHAAFRAASQAASAGHSAFWGHTVTSFAFLSRSLSAFCLSLTPLVAASSNFSRASFLDIPSKVGQEPFASKGTKKY
jgi:hypothetical protein